MTTLTTPTEKQILIVPVPENAYDFDIVNTYRKELRFLLKGTYVPLADKERYDAINLEMNTISSANILGVIENGNVQFDCEKLVEDCPFYAKMWRQYHTDNLHYPLSESCSTAKDSFMSFLQSKDVLVKNPLGERPQGVVGIKMMDSSGQWHSEFNDEAKAWQEAEKKVISKCVVIEKLKG